MSSTGDERFEVPYYIQGLLERDTDPLALRPIPTLIRLVQEELHARTVILCARTDTEWLNAAQIIRGEMSEELTPTIPWFGELCDRVVAAGEPILPGSPAEHDLLTEVRAQQEAAPKWGFAIPIIGHAGSGSCVIFAFDRTRLTCTQRQITHITTLAKLIAREFFTEHFSALREDHFRTLMEHLRESITIIGSDSTILYESPAARSMLGYPPDVLESWGVERLVKMIHPDDFETITRTTTLLLAHPEQPQRSLYRVQHVDGSWRWISSFATNMLHVPAVRGIIYTTSDITERKNHEDRLEFDATHDYLTGLPNRVYFMRQLEEAIAHKPRSAFINIDLDGYKHINDEFGHMAGDDALRSIVTRLLPVIGAHETLARFGGDEFTLLMPNTTAQEAIARSRRLLAALAAPIIVAGLPITVGASIGISLSPEHGTTFDELFNAADVALYQVKRTRRGTIGLYDPVMDAQERNRVSLGSSFPEAMERGEIDLHYQPIVDLATGKTMAAEALVRWNHPTQGTLYPSEFLATIEDLGYGPELARWSLRVACSRAAEWQIPISVNLSPTQIRASTLVEDVSEAIVETQLQPDLLLLEVSETAGIGGDVESIEKLTALRALGVKIAIDDFGTGYSGLSALRDYPADILKIDRQFISNPNHERNDQAIVRAILAIATALDLRVVAEGIETVNQQTFLRELGCDYGQGYALGMPVSADCFLRNLPASPRD